MDSFRDTTAYLMGEGVTLDQIAEAYGVTANTVNRWRMEGHPMHPREGWEGVLSDLLYAHAEDLKRRAVEAFRRARALSTGAGK
jgi:uncharacterized protein YjcR